MPSSENFDPSRIDTQRNKLYGIQARLRPNDGFAALMGSDWETVRWYATEQERDDVLRTIGEQHAFSRSGDAPALIYTPVVRNRSGGN